MVNRKCADIPLAVMGDPEGPGEALPNRLSNRDTIQLPDELSLSDSDPEDALSMPFAQRVEDLSSSSNDNDDDDDDDVIEVKGPKLRGIATVPPLGRGSSTGRSLRLIELIHLMQQSKEHN